mmetsp:Transcript_79162/g.181218  ORF Transcript_79162/g.181218 Transcript_79162/m.181218 type:complete len:165 (+) Transcript_79162:345-839(+)
MNQAEARAVLMKGEISRLTEDARVKQAACQDLRRHLASLDLSLQEAKSEVLEAREMHQFTEMELTQVLNCRLVIQIGGSVVQVVWAGVVQALRIGVAVASPRTGGKFEIDGNQFTATTEVVEPKVLVCCHAFVGDCRLRNISMSIVTWRYEISCCDGACPHLQC